MYSKITCFIVLLCFSFFAHAQFSSVEFSSKEFDQFKGSKTFVVLSGDPKYDNEIKSAMADTWKITSYEFIGDKEFTMKIADKSASFLILVDIEAGKYGQQYHYLALLNGGKKKLSAYRYDDLIAYCPINHYQNEPRDADCAYRVRNMLESMVMSMDMVQRNDIKGSSLKIAKELQKLYNAKSKNIPNRTLLICEDAIGKKLTKSDISGIYPYKFEMCSKEKIAQVIKEKSKDYYYFQPAITLNKHMLVFDPSNGEVVYFDFDIMGLDIKKSNLEDMVDAIKGK